MAFKIDIAVLSGWSACSDGKTWFAENFPDGGEAQDVFCALEIAGRRSDFQWLTGKMLTAADVSDMDALGHAGLMKAADLLVAEIPTVDPEDASRLSASGNDSSLAASGNYSRLAASGYRSKALAGENGAIALAWFDGQRPRFAVAYVGENGIKPNVFYTLDASGNDSSLAASGNYSSLAASGNFVEA